MNNYDLLQILGEIDDGMLERTARFRERRDRILPRRIRLPHRQIGVVAASLILLLCAVPVAKRLMNGFASGVIPPDTAPGTDVVENPDFVIENGVLLSYVGDDPHVVVPDEVIEISRDAFAEKGDIIDTITIGKNVETVDYLFLSHVDHLSGVVVEEENERFEVYEGVFVDKDNTYLIDAGGDFRNDFKRFLRLGDEIANGKLTLRTDNDTVNFIIDTTTVKVSIEKDYDNWFYTYITEITFNGNTVKFGDEYSKYTVAGNSDFLLEATSDVLLYSNTQYGMGLYYFITPNNAFDCSSPLGRGEPNDSFYFYSLWDDGNFHYKRLPRKFIITSDLEDCVYGLLYCTGFDEFHHEEGIVEINATSITHIPIANYTFAQQDDQRMEQYRLAFQQLNEYYFETTGQTYKTMEELFAYNKSIYESAK